MREAERRVHEARIADLKEAHERETKALRLTIDALAEQVEYLRAIGGRPQPFPGKIPGVKFAEMQPAEVPSVPSYEGNLVMSEEEEDLRAMKDAGLLDAESLEAALEALGLPVEIAKA